MRVIFAIQMLYSEKSDAGGAQICGYFPEAVLSNSVDLLDYYSEKKENASAGAWWSSLRGSSRRPAYAYSIIR